MKKISFALICTLLAFVFTSCQSGDNKDANGNTPSTVVEKMYQAIQTKDFALAASYNRLPDNVKISKENIYDQFKDYPADENGKVIITKEDWYNFLIDRMTVQSENYSLDSWEIVAEEVSNTDPNSAKVKTKIKITNQNVQSEAECSFLLKRENNIWFIIG